MFDDRLDEVRQISIAGLRQMGFLRKEDNRVTGTLSWCRGEEISGSVGASLEKLSDFDAWLDLDYFSNGTPIDYRIQLKSLPSNLGKGRVWYFICPFMGKRCRKLYQIGDRFLSRFAFPTALYSQQAENKNIRLLRAAFNVIEERDAETDLLSRRYAKPYYKGKPTRRYRRLLDRQDRVSSRLQALMPEMFR